MPEPTAPAPVWLTGYASNLAPALVQAHGVLIQTRANAVETLSHSATHLNQGVRVDEAAFRAALLSAVRASTQNADPGPALDQVRAACARTIDDIAAEAIGRVELDRMRAVDQANKAAVLAEAERVARDEEAERKARADRSAWEAADLQIRDAEKAKWAAYEAEAAEYRKWKAAQGKATA